MKTKKTTIRKKFVWIFLGLFLIQSVGIWYRTYSMNRESTVSRYSETALDLAKAAASYVDGDRIPEYLQTGEDESYRSAEEKLKDLKRNFEIQYLYIFIPDLNQNDATYLFDIGLEGDDASMLYSLGDQTGEVDVYDLIKEVYQTGTPVKSAVITQSEFGHLVSAYAPLFNSAGKTAAVVGVDIDVKNIIAQIRTNTIQLLTTMALLLFLCCFGMMVFVDKKILAPMKKLSDHMEQYGIDEKLDDQAIEIHTGDEIEAMADSYNLMSQNLKEYIRNLTAVTAEKERIGAELNVATRIQADMLPCIFPAFPERHEFDIYATMTPAKEVGGDFYDFFLVDDDHLAMVMADVSGKGVPAALFMMISKTLLKSAAQTGLTPKAILEKVNNQLCENNEAEMFVTVWLAILEISTGHMICANAGHEYPAIRKAEGDYELFKDKHGFVLAGMENAKYKEYELEMEPGDSIFVYTDGVAEATDANQELYGTDRMIQALNQKRDATCEELLDGLHKDVNLFVGEAPQFDDITMLCLSYRGTKEE